MAYAEIDTTRGMIVVYTAWSETELIKMVPGSLRDGEDKVWRLPLAWASYVTLRGVFRATLTIGPALEAWATEERTTRIDQLNFLRGQVTWPESWPANSVTRDESLYLFQVVGVVMLVLAGDMVLGDDMGTGKTIQVACALRAIGADSLPALVICPNGVKRHWARKLVERYPDCKPIVLTGGTANRRKQLAEARREGASVVIVNYESMRLLSRLAPYGSVKLKRCRRCDRRFGDEKVTATTCEVHPKPLNDFPFKTVVIDEAHHLGNAESKQTRACWSVMHGPTVTRRWGCTGTVLTNHVGNLWPIMHAVSPANFPRKTTWLDRYALMGWGERGGAEIMGLRLDTRDEFFAYFDPLYRRMLKDVVLPHLPPKTRTPRYVSMTTAQAKMYRELDERLITRDENGELYIAANNLVAKTRLMQLAAASVDIEKGDPDDITTWQVHLREPSPKLDDFEAVLDELDGRPCVVAFEHRELLDLAVARLLRRKIKFGLITGGQHESERDQVQQALHAGQIQMILYTIEAGKEGLDFSCVDTQINVQRSWRMVSDVQNGDRVLRIGSERHQAITVIDLITEGTIEERQVLRIYEKMARLEEINRDREQRAAAGIDTLELDDEYSRIITSDLGRA